MPESLQCVAMGLAKAVDPEDSRPTYKLRGRGENYTIITLKKVSLNGVAGTWWSHYEAGG